MGHELEAIFLDLTPPLFAFTAGDAIRSAIGIIDINHIIFADDAAVADFIADGLNILKFGCEIIFKAGVIEIIGGIEIPRVFIIIGRDEGKQLADISAFDGVAIPFAEGDDVAIFG